MTVNLDVKDNLEIKPLNKSKRLINGLTPDEYHLSDELYIGNPQYKFDKNKDNESILNQSNKDSLLLLISAINDGAFVEFIKEPKLEVKNNKIKIQYEVQINLIDKTDIIYDKPNEPIINYYSHYSSKINGTFYAQFENNKLNFVSNKWFMSQPTIKFSQGNGSVDEMCLKLERTSKKKIKQFKNNELNAITQPFYTYMDSMGLGLIDSNQYNEFTSNYWCGKNELILKTYIDIINYVENNKD